MISKDICPPEKKSASALRYLRDRISVPRDMPLLSGRLFRQALERTASIDSSNKGSEIPTINRLDQNPKLFN
jgi:glutathione S-transferase